MGINTGLVVVGSIGDNLRMDYTAVGDTTNLAARLQQVAEPDTILISETAQRLVQGYIRLEALPAIQVKGKTEPVMRYKVLGVGPRRSPLAGREERALSPFVGRGRELTNLEELLAQVEGGHGQVVGIVGEAGVGKSRLLYEFRRRVFKHALTQDVAYESLITTQRRALHAAAGQALEVLYADRLEEAYDRLAHHYARTDDAGKAVAYLTRFAEKAARSYANAEAVTALQEALGHVERLPAAERDHRILDIVILLSHSLILLGRFQDTLEILLQQQARVEQLQEPALAGPYYFWCAHTYSYTGDQERAAQSAQRAIEEGRRCGDDVTMGKAYYVLARRGFWSGQYLHGLEHGKQAVSLLERTPERWWLGQSHWAVAHNYYFMGAFARALAAAAQAHALGEALGDPRLQSYAAYITGIIEATRGEWEAGIAACHRSVAHSPDPLNNALALGFLGYAYLENGDFSAATSALEQAVQHVSRFRFRPLHGWYLALLGEAYLLSGQLDKARALVLQGLEITRDFRFQHGVGWAQRALGRTARVSGALAEAKTYFTEALQLFASTQDRFEVGRTHLELAILAHAQGDIRAATTHLHEAHSWFIALQVPKYIERTAQLAREYGVTLSAVAPQELMP
jgi:tetratricopeptide (TPR) repeat protein